MFVMQEEVQYRNSKGELRKGKIVARDVNTSKYYIKDKTRKGAEEWIEDYAITAYLKA